MKKLAEKLKRTELFSTLNESFISDVLLPLGTKQNFQKGEYVLLPLQALDRIGFVLKGKLSLLHIFPNGNYSLITTAVSGDLIGLDLVFTKTQLSPYHIVSNTASQILWIPASALLQEENMDEQSRRTMIKQLLSVISNENMKKEYRLAILSQKGLRDRIITFLTMQANKQQKRSFTLPFSREEMASFMCVNRSALSHELSIMQKEGLISFNEKEFTLHGWELDF